MASAPKVIGLMARNHRGFVEALIAANRIGADVLLLNTSFAGPALAEVLNRECAVGPLAVIYDEEFTATVDRALADKPDATRIVAWTDGPQGGLTVEKMIAEHAGRRERAKARRRGRVILLTSGTTGSPKGAKHSGAADGGPGILKAILDRTPWRAISRSSTNYLAAAPARSCAASCRTAPPVRRRFPLLRASAELLNAANGVRPLGREGYITLPVFAFGWPTTEMSPLYLTGSVLDAVRRGLRGDFRGARGRIALVLTVIAWALLWMIHRRNVASEPYFEEPLREALGDDYETIAAQSQPARRRRPIGVPPNELIRRRYVEKADTVQYGPHPKVNFADIWHRRDLPRYGKAPVLLQVPGGAWAIGMRRPQAYPLLSHLAERGWVCVSIDYRVSPRHTWPDHIVDVKRALAWIKENIAEYGGDPDFIAITGGSAGGHLCSLAALTPDDPQYQPGFEDADTSVVAAVPIYGRYDWYTATGSGRREFIALLQKFVVKKRIADHKQVYVDASPIRRLRPNAPPFFVLHGQDDSIIPVSEGREFVEALREVSTSTVAYAEIPHAQHAFDFYYGSPRAHYTARAVEEFLSWVHATRQATAP